MKKVVDSVWQTGVKPRWVNILECGHKFYAKLGDADAKYVTKRKCKECK